MANPSERQNDITVIFLIREIDMDWITATIPAVPAVMESRVVKSADTPRPPSCRNRV
jgi:hypothetical protein